MNVKAQKIKLKNTAAVVSVDVHSAAGLIAVAQQGNQATDVILSLYDINSLKLADVVESFTQFNISEIAFDYAGKQLFYAGFEDFIHVYDMAKKEKELIDTDNKTVKRITASPVDNKLIVGGKWLQVINAATLEVLWQMNDYEAFGICSGSELQAGSELDMHLNIPGQFIAEPPASCFYSGHHTVLVAGFNKPEVMKVGLSGQPVEVLLTDSGFQADSMELSADKNYLAVKSIIPDCDYVWDLRTGSKILTDVLKPQYGSSSVITFHSTRNILCTGSFVGYISLIDMASGATVFSERMHKNQVSSIKFFENGTKMVSAAFDGQVLITDVSEALKF